MNEGPTPALLEIDSLTVSYGLPSKKPFGRARRFAAVDSVSLTVGRGESVGLVGETGCGKSSLGTCCLRFGTNLRWHHPLQRN